MTRPAKKKPAKKKPAELKTKVTTASVAAYLGNVADPDRRRDCRTVLKMMREVTGARPKMWGPSIVGFGSYDYVYASGRSGQWPIAGFAPRKSDLTLYIMAGFAGAEDLLARLGRHKTGKSCLYIKRLSDVDLGVLRQLIEGSVAEMRRRYPD